MGNFQEENSILTKSILNRLFLKNWHYTNIKRTPFSNLELDITFHCDLACKYCYVNKYGDTLYPKELRKNDVILKNTRSIINWLIKNELNPTLEIFSGEPFSQKIGFLVLNEIYNIYKDAPEYVRPKDILIPTNFTFILSDKLTQMVNELKNKFNDIGINFFLSASIEGKYMEQNRPFKYRKDDPRDDEFYDKVFTLCAQNGYGFHPMVYSNGIEKWIDNFLWFQEMFKKYNINPFRLYLLEVRNAEWTAGQVKEFQKFYDFLIKWTFTELFYSDKQLFVNKAVNGHCGFNMIPSVVSIVGRGLGCSIQSSVYLRLGDLKIFPCHRTFYKQFQTAQFKTDNDGNIIDIDGINPELMVAVYSFESNVAPYCEGCINKYFCAKGCLGSQFETTGDLFTPIPNVCQLEFGRTFQFVKTMKEIGVLDLIKNRLRNNLLIAMNIFEDLIDNKTTSEGGNL